MIVDDCTKVDSVVTDIPSNFHPAEKKDCWMLGLDFTIETLWGNGKMQVL